MPARSDDPLRKVTLNLYEADCEFLSRYIGHGWSETVRTLVHAYAEGLRQPKLKRYFGDLTE
jgi:hypothetical protein